jgi:heme O synthase-like polyprenyltransferase
MHSKVVLADLWSLTKPGITRLVLVTTGVGFYLGASGSLDLALLQRVEPVRRAPGGR